jgi:type IV secretory pathway VirB2 component (pilin)
MKSKLFFLFALLLLVGAGTAHAAGAGGGGLPWEVPLTVLSNSITGPVAYTISICGIVGCGAALIFLGGVVSEFLRGVLFVVLVIAVIITAKNTLTSFGFAAGAKISLIERTDYVA